MTVWDMNFHLRCGQLVMAVEYVHYVHGQDFVVAVKFHAMTFPCWKECFHHPVSF